VSAAIQRSFVPDAILHENDVLMKLASLVSEALRRVQRVEAVGDTPGWAQSRGPLDVGQLGYQQVFCQSAVIEVRPRIV